MTRPKKVKKPEAEHVTVGNVTIKIYRVIRGKYAYYQVAGRTPDGRRKMQSFGSLEAATKEADRVARAINSGQVEASNMSSSQAASFGRALELLRPTGDGLEIACARYAEAVEALGSGTGLAEAVRFYVKHNPANLRPKLVPEVVAELLASKEGHSDRYRGDLQSRLGRFAKDFQTPMASVATSDVQRWVDGLKVTPLTKVNYKRLLGVLFEFAIAHGYAAENPAVGVITPKIQHLETEIWTPGEMRQLLNAAGPEFLPIVAIAGFAGLRSAEIQKLTWDDVRLDERFIVVQGGKSKTGSRRIVPIADNLAAWLAPYSNRKGLVWGGAYDAFYDAQQNCAQAAGITWKANALRHSFASYRLAATQDAAKTALESGNSPGMIFKHYHQLVSGKDAQSWFAIQPNQAENVVNLPARVA